MAENPSSLPDMLTSKEVAALFGVGIRTVAGWARSGRIPSVRTLSGRYIFPKSTIYELCHPATATAPHDTKDIPPANDDQAIADLAAAAGTDGTLQVFYRDEHHTITLEQAIGLILNGNGYHRYLKDDAERYLSVEDHTGHAMLIHLAPEA